MCKLFSFPIKLIRTYHELFHVDNELSYERIGLDFVTWKVMKAKKWSLEMLLAVESCRVNAETLKILPRLFFDVTTMGRSWEFNSFTNETDISRCNYCQKEYGSENRRAY